MKELINRNKVKVPQNKLKLSSGSFTTDEKTIGENFSSQLARPQQEKNPP